MDAADTPRVGYIVLHGFLWYGFLWRREQLKGQIEARKTRPCLILAVEAATDVGGAPVITVLPITTVPPDAAAAALPVPREAKMRMGLDALRDQWLLLEEANRFAWPGFDLVPQAHGGFFETLN